MSRITDYSKSYTNALTQMPPDIQGFAAALSKYGKSVSCVRRSSTAYGVNVNDRYGALRKPDIVKLAAQHGLTLISLFNYHTYTSITIAVY